MARAVSWNWELHFDNAHTSVIYPTSVGEFGEGEEGRIDVADGDRKYKIRDQIYAINEIEITILIKNDRREYDLMQEWCMKGATRNMWLVAKGAGRDTASGGTGREEKMRFLLGNCQCAMGKKSAFDRQSKTFDSKKYFLIPETVEEVRNASTESDPSAVIY